MSAWTYVKGYVQVSPPGHGQHAKLFTISEVLDHLPRVSGSEGDMSIQLSQRAGYNQYASHDEFMSRPYRYEMYKEQSSYIIFVDGALRDTFFEDTMRAFAAWMNRLSKRVQVEDMLVRISGCRQYKSASDKPDWSAHYVFDGAGAWRENYIDALEQRRNEKPFSRRLVANWRYDETPDTPFWTERLHELIPFDGRENLDIITGNGIPEEYLTWDNETKQYTGIDADVKDLFNTFDARYQRTKRIIDQLSQCEDAESIIDTLYETLPNA